MVMKAERGLEAGLVHKTPKKRTVITPTISSLALLKVSYDRQRKDYFDNFVPMIAECLRRSAEGGFFAAPAVQPARAIRTFAASERHQDRAEAYK